MIKNSSGMSEEEAKKYIANLTYIEKVKLNELLKGLEQKRRLFLSLQESIRKDDV